jgi:beta-glucosidase
VCFGHGLGYTTWDYLGVEAEVAADGSAVLHVHVRNTGHRSGREVVQVYLSRTDSALERPALWLAGFASVKVDRGQEGSVDVPVPRRAFEHWDAGTRAWVVEGGRFTALVGRSSADVRLTTAVVMEVGTRAGSGAAELAQDARS